MSSTNTPINKGTGVQPSLSNLLARYVERQKESQAECGHLARSVFEWNSRHPQIGRFNHGHTPKLFSARHHRPDSKTGWRVPQSGRQHPINAGT